MGRLTESPQPEPELVAAPVEGTCVEHLHAHVGICYRRGLADGYAQGLAARGLDTDPDPL